jgi:hypothetical protein
VGHEWVGGELVKEGRWDALLRIAGRAWKWVRLFC